MKIRQNDIPEDTFSTRLYNLRKKMGLKQSDIADAIKVQRTTYAGYESLGRTPSYDKISAIADLLGTSADYLCCRTDERGVETRGISPLGLSDGEKEQLDRLYSRADAIARAALDTQNKESALKQSADVLAALSMAIVGIYAVQSASDDATQDFARIQSQALIQASIARIQTALEAMAGGTGEE